MQSVRQEHGVALTGQFAYSSQPRQLARILELQQLTSDAQPTRSLAELHSCADFQDTQTDLWLDHAKRMTAANTLRIDPVPSSLSDPRNRATLNRAD
jgi:hypothetical protein